MRQARGRGKPTSLLHPPLPPLPLRPGDVRQGRISEVRPEGLTVEVDGLKGLVPSEDLEDLDEETRAGLAPGQEVTVYVLHPRDNGNPLFSLSRTRILGDWQRAEEIAARGEVWEADVVGCNRGGLVVAFGSIHAFVPASQVTGINPSSSPLEKRRRLRSLVGQRLRFKILEVDPPRGRLVLSEREGRRLYRRRHRTELLDTLKEGAVVRGVVSNLCEFGAFVDLGGADGLVHLSEICWEPIDNPAEKLQVGDEVEAVVLKLDRRRGRIGLSLKRLQPDPWDSVEGLYHERQLVEGVVTRLASFGAFVRVEPGVEGLVHVSELADDLILDPVEVVEEGELLLLRVVRVDAAQRRLGLSLRQVSNEEWAEWARRKHQAGIMKSAGETPTD